MTGAATQRRWDGCCWRCIKLRGPWVSHAAILSDDHDQPDSPSAPRHRAVRSFVLRTGRMTHGQQRALDEYWPRYGVEFTPQPLNLDECFGRHAPRMIEIGFGTGEALAAFAMAHPEMDCLGIEVHRPGAGNLLLRMEAAQLSNVRISCHDAVEVLTRQLSPGSIDLVHIFFPDPWHKKRHHKRRLIQSSFADVVAGVLKIGGTLRLATDWQDYAVQMREVLDAHPRFANLSSDPTLEGYMPRPDDRPLTRFERRGHRLGHGVWDLAYSCVDPV